MQRKEEGERACSQQKVGAGEMGKRRTSEAAPSKDGGGGGHEQASEAAEADGAEGRGVPA